MVMARALRLAGIIVVRHWPALVAWYLAGESVRAFVIEIAAPIGPEQSPVLALLLVPLAVLARLVAYVGMFLSIRSSLPQFTRMTRSDPLVGFRAVARDFFDVLVAAIVPFFVLYGLIGGVDGDLNDYQQAAYRYSFASKHEFWNLGDQPLLVGGVIVVAFLLRQVLRHVGDRLRRVTGLLGIYLEATWVFVAVSGISAVFGPAVEWVQDRQIVAWWLGLRESISNVWSGFRGLLDGLGVATPIAVQLVLLPLAWLLIAGSVYTRTLEEVGEERFLPRRAEVRMRASMLRMPRVVRHQLALFRGDWEESYKPLAVVGRLIVRAGIVNVVVFVVAYAVLYSAGQWLVRGLILAVGPHDETFWQQWLPLIGIVAGIVIEPIRIALLGAAFDASLETRHRRRSASALVQGEPDADGMVRAGERHDRP